jgi:hypothetical protein
MPTDLTDLSRELDSIADDTIKKIKTEKEINDSFKKQVDAETPHVKNDLFELFFSDKYKIKNKMITQLKQGYTNVKIFEFKNINGTNPVLEKINSELNLQYTNNKAKKKAYDDLSISQYYQCISIKNILNKEMGNKYKFSCEFYTTAPYDPYSDANSYSKDGLGLFAELKKIN